GGVSTLPKHPHELIGEPDRRARATNAANARYERATSAANTGPPSTSAPTPMTTSATPPARTSAVACGQPSACSACAVSAESTDLNAPPSTINALAITNGPAST